MARMSGYIGLMAGCTAALQTGTGDLVALVSTFLAVWIAVGVLSLPITWEFGQMYLDLWNSTLTLRELAAKDQQTGLLNNRSFVGAVEEKLAAGRRVALLLGDLDRFKSINDRYGHPIGDDVIAAVGATLRDLFGETAVMGRMGGEEYAVAIECPFTDGARAKAHTGAVAEELRSRVAELRLSTESGPVRPTISVGVAWSRDRGNFSDLYSRADKALYVAKTAGRDRVVDEFEVEVLDPERALARRQDLYWRDTRAPSAA